MMPYRLLAVALLWLAGTTGATAQPADPMQQYRVRFQAYIGGIETTANTVLEEAMDRLSPDERKRIPAGLKVRVGWSQKEQPMGDCRLLGQPAMIDYRQATIWVCEEGIRAVATLMEAHYLAFMSASNIALEAHQAGMDQLDAAALATFNRHFKKTSIRFIGSHVMERYVGQIDAGAMRGQRGPLICFGYVLAYLAIHAQDDGGALACSREQPDAELERRAAVWARQVIGRHADNVARVLGAYGSRPVEIPEQGPQGFGSVIFEQVTGYFVLHELGHAVAPGVRIPMNAPAAQKIGAEVAADTFALAPRFDESGMKTFVMVPLYSFWHALVPYGTKTGADAGQIDARGKSIELLMCDERHWSDIVEPKYAARMKEIRRLGCPTQSGASPK